MAKTETAVDLRTAAVIKAEKVRVVCTPLETD